MTRSRHLKRRIRFVFLSLVIGTIANHAEIANARQSAVQNAQDKAWLGKRATAFTLPGIDGKQVNIAKDLGKRPVVLVFYRGVW